MKKLITTLSIMILLLGATILTSNKAYAADSNTSTTKHSINEVITYVTSSIYNPLNNQYINSAMTEDNQIYKFYSDINLYSTWQVLIIDTKGTTDMQDDEVINSYNLNDYQFSDN